MSHAQSPMDIAHRIGIWVAMVGLAVYVLNIGQWVGAADEKFKSAQTVEEKQDKLILDVNTIQVTQGAIQRTQTAQTNAIAANARAIEDSKDEILDAIKAATED